MIARRLSTSDEVREAEDLRELVRLRLLLLRRDWCGRGGAEERDRAKNRDASVNDGRF